MIIAINTRLLLKNKLEGIGRFSFEILKRITNEHKEHTFIFIFDRPYDESFIFSDNIIPVRLFPPARHPFLWYFFFEISISRALKKYKADIFITTDGWLSLKTKVKTLQVLHDLHFDNYPEFLPFLTRKYYQYFFPKFIKKADRIITVSNFCKLEISEKYSINIKNIDVVYNSTREDYIPLNEKEKTIVKKQYTDGHSYFLFIGPIHKRKNINNVIKAFLLYKSKYADHLKSVVTGCHMWRRFNKTKQYWNNLLIQDIIFTGYLSDSELYKITAAAECLLYPSFYEGFGLPILEAMSCNIPVITSNCSSMPEVAKDAAMLINPYSVDEIEMAMHKIEYNEAHRLTLINSAQNNLKRFSWDNSSQLFWESIMKTINT